MIGANPWLDLRLALMLIYGSLPQSPTVQSPMVCQCFLQLLSKKAGSRTPFVVDGVAFVRYFPSKYAFSKGELRSESLMKIIDYEIDTRWLDMLLEHPDFLLMESLAYEVDELSFMSFGGLRVIASPNNGSFVGLFSIADGVMVPPSSIWFHLIPLHKQHDVATIEPWLTFSMMIACFQDSTRFSLMLFPIVESLILLRDSHVKYGFQEVTGLFQHLTRDIKELRVVGSLCLTIGSLYGSLPRPPEDNHLVFGRFQLPAVSCSRLLQLQQIVSFVCQKLVDILPGLLFQLSAFQAQIFCISPCDAGGVFVLNAFLLLQQHFNQVSCSQVELRSWLLWTILVAIFGRFDILTKILFGSLQRPPEVLC